MEVHSNSGRFPSLSVIPSPSRVILALTVIITLYHVPNSACCGFVCLVYNC